MYPLLNLNLKLKLKLKCIFLPYIIFGYRNKYYPNTIHILLQSSIKSTQYNKLGLNVVLSLQIS